MVILITILFMLPYFKYLPQTTLAAVVLYAAWGLIEAHDIVYFFHLRAWADLAIVAACSLVTLLAGVEVRRRGAGPPPARGTRSLGFVFAPPQAGILFALLISVLLVVKNVTQPVFSILQYDPPTSKFVSIETASTSSERVDGALIVLVHVRAG